MAGRTRKPVVYVPVNHIPIPPGLEEVVDWRVTAPYFCRRTRELTASQYGPYTTLAEAADVLMIVCQRWFGVGVPPARLEPSATAETDAGPVTVRLSEIYRRAWGPRPLVMLDSDDDD